MLTRLVIDRKLSNNIWDFIDRTLKQTCQPTQYQNATYSGHKRCHGIKFQNVTTPDGNIAHLYGPIAGSHRNSYMLSCSSLLLQLHELMLAGEGIYSLFGDPAYPMSAYLYGGVSQPAPRSIKAGWHTQYPWPVLWWSGCLESLAASFVNWI
jgi:DDE superfamily endonuclease